MRYSTMPRPRSKRLNPADAALRADLFERQRKADRRREIERADQAQIDALPFEHWYGQFEDMLADAAADSGLDPDTFYVDILRSALLQTPARHRAELRRVVLGY